MRRNRRLGRHFRAPVIPNDGFSRSSLLWRSSVRYGPGLSFPQSGFARVAQFKDRRLTVPQAADRDRHRKSASKRNKESKEMAADTTNDSHLYLGLAGETGHGRVVQTGLYRMADGGDDWEALHNGLPEAPAVRALAVHPLHPEIVYAGTQSGPYRSDDRGLHWAKIAVPDHGLPVWSFLCHPADPDFLFLQEPF